MTPDTFGPTSETPLAQFDPVSHCWKMLGAISLWEEQQLLVTLPVSGMTVNGVLYQRPAWVPITVETELLSWPTPRANTAMASLISPEIANNPKRFPNLETVVGRRMWPTPVAAGGLDGGSHSRATMKKLEGTPYEVPSTGKLNPTWVELR
jgi:hypothetical protein